MYKADWHKKVDGHGFKDDPETPSYIATLYPDDDYHIVGNFGGGGVEFYNQNKALYARESTEFNL